MTTQDASPEAPPLPVRLTGLIPELSKREARAARHLAAHFPLAGLGTVAEFAQASGVSTATVLRLVRKLGYDGYTSFQTALKAHLETSLQSPLTRYDMRRDGPDPAQGGDFPDRYFGQLAADMTALQQGLDRHSFEEIVELLSNPRRPVFVIGGRYSGHIARYFSDLLTSIRPGVTAMGDSQPRWDAHLLDIGRLSVVVVFDVRRYQSDLAVFAQQAAAQKAHVILLTDPWMSPIARVAGHVLSFPVAAHSVFDVLVSGMAVAEALLAAIARKTSTRGKDRMTALERLRDRQHNARGD